MRIISGYYKGRKIQPTGLPVRPTTDMAKEALFNILNNLVDYEDSMVLDLFAGTGNISFEFLSRGSKSVISVEHDLNCVRFIKNTAEKLEIDNISVLKMDVFKFISNGLGKYDIIFADPPYDEPRIAEIPTLVFDNGILADNGILILEHPDTYHFESNIHFFDHRRYSRVNFSFFK